MSRTNNYLTCYSEKRQRSENLRYCFSFLGNRNLLHMKCQLGLLVIFSTKSSVSNWNNRIVRVSRAQFCITGFSAYLTGDPLSPFLPSSLSSVTCAVASHIFFYPENNNLFKDRKLQIRYASQQQANLRQPSTKLRWFQWKTSKWNLK